ncbi:MAG: NifU family protein [Bacteroidota bacterium]
MQRRASLYIEGVPNPNAMKFVLENGILVDEPYEYNSLAEAGLSPLAHMLLSWPYVEKVLLNRNYVTVVKKIDQSPPWDDILASVKNRIQQHLESNKPILYLGSEKLNHPASEDSIVELVKQILDKKIRPAAQEDGGDILFDSYEDGVLNLSMHGACHLCPYAVNTLKEGVEPLLTNLVPEIKRVTAVENHVM